MLTRCIYITRAERSISKPGHLQPCAIQRPGHQVLGVLAYALRTHFLENKEEEAVLKKRQYHPRSLYNDSPLSTLERSYLFPLGQLVVVFTYLLSFSLSLLSRCFK